MLADEYSLTHKMYDWGHREDLSSGCQVRMSGEVLSPGLKSSYGWRDKGDQSRTCNYCLGKGHWKNECPALRSQNNVPQNTRGPKPADLAVCAHQMDREKALAAVKFHTNPKPTAGECDPGYAPYLHEGYVSLLGSDTQVPVRILRDTGALESFVVESVLPFSSETDTGSCVLFKGMGMQLFSAPLHRFSLSCALVKGQVSMGVRPSLPVPGVAIVLGNDLAGNKVWPDLLPSLVVSSTPVVREPADPEVFPACAVTRAQTGKEEQI